jgi:hypothetical protein
VDDIPRYSNNARSGFRQIREIHGLFFCHEFHEFHEIEIKGKSGWSAFTFGPEGPPSLASESRRALRRRRPGSFLAGYP